ncbi:MAG: lytic transglycosylase domain-containing protein [Candidatus Latescibacterota bacterium]
MSRWMLVGSNIVIFIIAVYIVDLRIGDLTREEGSPQISKSSIVPVGLVIREVQSPPGKVLEKPKIRTGEKHVFDSIRPWLPLIRKYAKEYGVDPDLVAAVLYIESKGDPYTVSPAGALGLMQITPGTANYLGVGDVLDPEENIKAGVKYLSWLINKYDEPSALLAYNAGLGMLERNRIPKETQQFVEKVLSLRSFLQDSKKRNDLS